MQWELYFSVAMIQSFSCPCWEMSKEELGCKTKEEVNN